MANKMQDLGPEYAASIHSDSDDEGSLGADSRAGSTSHEDTMTKQGDSSDSHQSKSEEEFAKQESRAIFWLRLIVLSALVCVAVAVCVAIFMLTKNAQKKEFRSSFDGSADKVITSFQDIVSSKLTSVGSLSVATTAYARDSNSTWPFVTVSHFQDRCLPTRENSDSLFLRLVPKVPFKDREAWESYSVDHVGWLFEHREHVVNFSWANAPAANVTNRALGEGNAEEATVSPSKDNALNFSSGIADEIYYYDKTGTPVADKKQDFYMPLWQQSPLTPGRDITNFNCQYYTDYLAYMLKTFETGDMSIGGIETSKPGSVYDPIQATNYFALILSAYAGKEVYYNGEPMSSIFYPVFESFDRENDTKPVAIIFAVFRWAIYFERLLPTNAPGVIVILENNCDGPFTYLIKGENATYLGQGDLHDQSFNSMERTVNLGDKASLSDSKLGVKLNQDLCAYKLRVYPTQDMYDVYVTSLPIIIACTLAVVFAFTVALFLFYNWYVERRQKLVHRQAVQATAVVSSLFPEAVRNKLLNIETEVGPNMRKKRLNNFLADGESSEAADDKPIADLFPNCTVFFGDIAGFTAWSSSRDPAQVFVLLQTIYQAFDVIAKRRKVFKVETIGDSYVAVCGLPNPDRKHFVTMSRFAADCLLKFKVLVKELEVKLGPDTADLDLRIGLHSGPVTAGVLRGERSRFQLFGDTVNTASRMESSGVTGKIQISSSTAQLLREAGKEHWLKHRQDSVLAKGKGIMDTYFLFPRSKGGSSISSRSDDEVDASSVNRSTNLSSASTSATTPKYGASADGLRQDRLVHWVVEQLSRRIKKVVARHEALGIKPEPDENLIYRLPEGKTSLDEIVDVIPMPDFDHETANISTSGVHISPEVIKQLQKLVATIALLYKNNPFHNFEHACHVAMSVDKFLSRIVAPDIEASDIEKVENANEALAQLHDYTHGITSDDMTLFAIVFSALIHDADHRGVSNPQLAKEDQDMAAMYNNKSIAEQNSVDICWDLLMSDEYALLRRTMFKTHEEMMRFRQVVVNVVLATDIFDKEFNDVRKSRWNRAFHENQDDKDLRATIVIEHIIQASDVSHTMQHWHIYRKWNERLFMEMYSAYKAGRMGKDPSTFWYQGEIGFFDNYVIPLAKKLEQCGVFGVSSDECLNYAKQNRNEWEQKGQEVLESLVEKARRMDAASAEEDAARASTLTGGECAEKEAAMVVVNQNETEC